MSWENRLREAAYTAPDGQRFVFSYEDVKKETTKKTTAFNFADADGTYIQDLGREGLRFPLEVIFHGDDYDQQADRFEAALLQRGAGKLEHPIYGVHNVVAFGRITRSDNLKTAGNQAKISVRFIETSNLIYPSQQESPSSSVLTALLDFSEGSSFEFSSLVGIRSSIERVALKTEFLKIFDNAKRVLSPIASIDNIVKSDFETIINSIENSIDILSGEPETLSRQTILMMQSPGYSSGTIESKTNIYESIIDDLVSIETENEIIEIDSQKSNKFHIKDLFVTSALTGIVISVLNTTFQTKNEALQAAEKMFDKYQEVVNWRENNFIDNDVVDTGATFQQLRNSISLAAGFLVDLSFSLKQEKSIILKRDTTFINLCASLYNSLDDDIIDFMITSNNLTGSEIIELPKGKEILYYV